MKAKFVYLSEGPKENDEPTHLVGMWHLLDRKGYKTDISVITPKEAGKAIQELKEYDLLLLSVYNNKEHIAAAEEILKNFNGISVIGGGITDIRETFPNNPFVVKGQGEAGLAYLIEKEFRTDERIIHKINIPLDKIEFKRPYDLKDYIRARPIFQTGCVGKCTFCCNTGKIDYKSPEKAREEIEYLLSKGVTSIYPLGPDFTTNPNKANEIINILSKYSDLKLGITCRADTLVSAIKKNYLNWRILSENNFLIFETGIESFSKKKLIRLGKYKEDQKIDQLENIITILYLLPNSGIGASWILFDPDTTLEELKTDLTTFLAISKRFRYRLLLVGDYTNCLGVLEGTEVWKKYPERWHFKDENVRKVFRFAYELEKNHRDNKDQQRIETIKERVDRGEHLLGRLLEYIVQEIE